MKSFNVGTHSVSQQGPCYVIAEIGNNHQGDIKTALTMIKVAAGMGVNAVKFQKRDNKQLFTKAMYNKPYENENSYGATYGEHREFLEFNLEQYQAMKACAQENDVDIFATPFDYNSVDFLEEVGVCAYKIASADVTNLPLLSYIAKHKKPMFISTGAATLDEVRIAYQAIIPHNNKLCFLHCTAGYPTEYENLNLRAIETLKQEFTDCVIGYSGHDYGILAPTIAYMLGATVVEKHFTLNRSWKGTDHKFSLEPTGLYKMVRDLRRVDLSMGDGRKIIQDFEKDARKKMGKSLYAAKNLKTGTVLTAQDVVVKSPGGGVPPYKIDEMIGKRLLVDVLEETPLSFDNLEAVTHPQSNHAV